MNVNGSVNDSKPSGETQLMNLQDVAMTLSVSSATVRNWMKAGKVRKVSTAEGALLFNRAEILELKEEIELGAFPRLKSRRNKRAIEGNGVPMKYVDSVEYIRVTEEILEIVSSANVQIPPQFILLEIALRLLVDKGVLQDEPSSGKLSLTEKALQQRLNLGVFGELLLELGSFRDNHHDDDSMHPIDLYKLSPPFCEVLREVHRCEIHWVRGEDLLGLVYMSLSHLGTRKSKGSYYTPAKLVNTLVQQSLNSLEDVLSQKILDPCCGSGNFLIKLFIALVERAEGSGLSREEAEKKVMTTILNGYDIDPIAVVLAKLNLVLLLDVSLENHQAITEILQSLDLHIKQKNTLENNGRLFGAAGSCSYNLVIGNPPWGYSFSKEEIKAYRNSFISAKMSVESFSLFIEYGLSILEEGGLLAFVLPEALLNVNIHSSIRRLLLEKTRILQINVLGHQFSQVFTPTITLLARLCVGKNQKRNREQDQNHGQNRNKSWSQKLNSDMHSDGAQLVRILQGEETHSISQKRFLENEMYIFNVKASNQEVEILKDMRTLPGAVYLAGNAEFALGIVTGLNKEYVLAEPREGAEPVLKGNDVFKYKYSPTDNYLIFEPDKFQQVAPVHLYRAPEKLIYRFINESLVFAYDDRQILSLNSANIVIPRVSGYSMKYILAVLNSRAAQFFHSVSFSSVKVLRKHLESIPIPPCDFSTQKKIIDRVEGLMNSLGHSESRQLYEQIDEQIMHLYALTSEQQDLIRRSFQDPRYLP